MDEIKRKKKLIEIRLHLSVSKKKIRSQKIFITDYRPIGMCHRYTQSLKKKMSYANESHWFFFCKYQGKKKMSPPLESLAKPKK